MQKAWILLAILVMAGCASQTSSDDETSQTTSTSDDAPYSPQPFEPQEPSEDCGQLDSLEPVLPVNADPTGLALGWDLLQLELIVVVDGAFAETHGENWTVRIDELVADVNDLYEAQVGLHLNTTLMVALPNASLQPGTHDGQERAVARGFLAANYPDVDFDLVAVILGADYQGAVAGEVECVHGAVNKENAFLWAEYTDPRDCRLPGLGFCDIPLKVFAHELAHLLAAHHHYTNCLLPLADLRTEDATGICGIMVNDIGLASLRFSETNRLVVRSFVEELGIGEPV